MLVRLMIPLMMLGVIVPPAGAAGGDRPILLHIADAPQAAPAGTFSGAGAGGLEALAYPGLYGLIDRPSLALGHTQLFAGTSADALALAFPTLEHGTFGGALYRIASGKAEGRDEFGRRTGSFSEEQLLARTGYGTQVRERLGIGANASYLHRELAGERSAMAGVGLGAHYRGRRFGAGFGADNILAMKSGATEDSLPLGLRVNAGCQLLRDVLLLGADATIMPSLEVRAGIEYMLGQRLSLRLSRGESSNLFGIGFQARSYRFDYDMGLHELGASHQVKLGYLFGSSRSQRRESLSEQGFQDARLLAGEGRYPAASAALRRVERFGKLSPDRKAFAEALDRVLETGTRELDGGNELTATVRHGVSLYLEDKPDMARAVFLQVQSKDPYNRLVGKFLALTVQRDQRTAPPSFVDVDPVRLKLFKTEEYFQKQQWDLALKECKEIVAINPAEVMAYVRMGSVYFALGLKQDAVKAWEYAAALNSGHIEVRKALAFMKAEHLQRLADMAGETKGGGGK